MASCTLITTVTGLMFTNMKHQLNCPTTVVDASLYGCFELCWRDRQCLSFFARESPQKCCLAPSRYLEGDLVGQPGINYFWLYPDYCHPDTGYTLSRQTDLCYRLYTEQKSWDTANQKCKADGGSLIKLNTPRKINHIKDVITSSSVYNSIGGFAIGGILSGQWAWSDGSEITHDDWDDGQPVPDVSKTRVVMAMTSGYKWKSAEPVESGGYICELPFVSLNPYV
ncbi:brevican core protein-like [Haliotis rubra]|uniref:brevican core protein-like n=1 Tax=Haliotis rubra TaxID=36100 RepID=UPI001EE5CA81|nr:brevican core protein-like [Haliotis rubra]